MKEKMILGGALVAGFLASLCCIGPLLFVLLGVSAFGAAGILGWARPYLMGGAVLLLVAAFYLVCFKRSESCAPDGTCTVKGASRANRIGLWTASVAVLAFALVPYYAGPIAAKISDKKSAGEPVQEEDCCVANKGSDTAATSDSAAPATPGMEKTILVVEGMTCSSCETPIKMALERTPGVSHAQVSYDRGEAVIEYDPKKVSRDELRETINKTGYTAREGK